MKRNPKDHVPYSNRAACYQKLMEWQLAVIDCDKCIAMCPTFVKAWTRKGGACLRPPRQSTPPATPSYLFFLPAHI